MTSKQRLQRHIHAAFVLSELCAIIFAGEAANTVKFLLTCRRSLTFSDLIIAALCLLILCEQQGRVTRRLPKPPKLPEA